MDHNMGLMHMCKYLVYMEYFWLLSVEVQFGVIPFGSFPIFADLVHVSSNG